MKRFVVSETQSGVRLDALLAEILSKYSRSSWQTMIASGHVRVNDVVKKSKYSVKEGDILNVIPFDDEKMELQLPVIYEDHDVLVINKPHGLLVHPRGELQTEPSVTSLIEDKLQSPDGLRPGIVHRLDRDTSGLMIIAKNDETKSYLMKQFQNRSVKKEYLAVIAGHPADESAVLKWPIARNQSRPSTFRVDPGGKVAVTHMKLIERRQDTSLVVLTPQTGRTHQLRVHMTHYGHPIVGDRVYGKVRAPQGRLMLHAWKLNLAIRHNEYREFEAPIPEGFDYVEA